MSDSPQSDPLFPEESVEGNLNALSPFDVDSLDATPKTAAPPNRDRLPTPGISGAIGWSCVALLLHVVGSFIALAVVLSIEISEKNIPPDAVQKFVQDPELLLDLVEKSQGILIGVEMVTFGLGVIAFTLFYFRANLRAALPLQTPRWQHAVLILLWFMPLSIFCTQLAVWANIGWNEFASNVPALDKFKDFNTMEQVGNLKDKLSFPMMLFLIAIIPAICEELLFRGIIGRGLVARYGFVGILLTTIFFSAVHMHPVHVVAVAPLSIAIHWGYLATRNLWIPIFAHFLNNAWAVVLIFHSKEIEPIPEPARLADEAFLPWWVTASALACSLVLGWLLWEMRTIYRTPDRERWEPPFLSTDRPAVELDCDAEMMRPSALSISASAIAVLLFWSLFTPVILQELAAI